MVVPVPVVLHEGDVKTLPKDVFEHVEQMGAPRLVEYWEQDPCAPRARRPRHARWRRRPTPTRGAAAGETEADLGVKIEAQFAVGEYEIVILSAKDSTGLDTWLRQREATTIPAGAEPLLRPYVEGGMKFFVAKVDPKKVKFDGRPRRAVAAALPLRQRRVRAADPARARELARHAGSDRQHPRAGPALRGRELPERHDPDEPRRRATACRSKFGAFYAALFDRTLEKNPGAVVTEYAWQASTLRSVPGAAARSDADFADARRRRARRRGQPATTRRLRAHAPARALRQGRSRTTSCSSAAPPIVGRPRVRARRDGTARGGRAAVGVEQLPGPLRDPPRVDRPDRCEHPRRGAGAARRPARAGRSRPSKPALEPRVRAARPGAAREPGRARRAGDRRRGRGPDGRGAGHAVPTRRHAQKKPAAVATTGDGELAGWSLAARRVLAGSRTT